MLHKGSKFRTKIQISKFTPNFFQKSHFSKSSAIEKLDYQLNKTNNRVYELENYENLAKPLNSIKIQNLSDQLNSLNNKSALELIDLDTLNQNRLNRDQQEFTTQRDSILEKSVDKSIAKYPDRLIRELFLNNKMKQEKIKFEQEIILLKQEIQDLVEKIKDLPKSDFCDRNKSHSLNFKTKIDEDEEIQFDFERKIHLPI